MAGRKYATIVLAKTPATYHSMTAAEQAKPSKAMDQVMKKYAGKIDIVRRYWTSIASADVSDVFIVEGDSPEDLHAFQEDLDRAFAKLGGDPTRFGTTVDTLFGINPDADTPKARKR